MSLTEFGGGSAGAVFVPEDGRRLGTVLICHERYGLVQHTLDLAKRLADAGYLAIAPDFTFDWDGDKAALARGDVTADLEDAVVIRHLGAAAAFAAANLVADPDRVAVVGVCASGSYPLLASSVLPRLAAVLMLYGGASDTDVTDERRPSYREILSTLHAPVLGIFGEDDHVVALPDVLRLRGLLEDNGISYEFTLFPHMPHGWLNSTMSQRYRPREGEQAWSLVLSFLDRAFAGEFDRTRRVWRFSADVATDYDFTTKVRLP